MKTESKLTIHRGDIYHVTEVPTCGCEQRAGRPAVIVSNDVCNRVSSVVEIVYLTTRRKAILPTHVEIQCEGRRSLALCEQITSVSINRLRDYKCHVTEAEMILVDQALAISLDIYDQINSSNKM